jgi:ABC-type multidrug transport system ATPase subunit
MTKTTLLDVIAMRKTSGEMSGSIRLNGFPQERTSFLRCSGYVEQFDVQQPELTVRETVEFCARLRLDAKDPNIRDDAGKLEYAARVLEILELSEIQNLQVGSFEEGGLTFEQRKRLAIACELAASPSIIFLDEPTSGLDSRGALIVIRAMKRIAATGRTVCATIHQPSSAVFEMFDDLLLMKGGGNVVFFGELGSGSWKLIDHFESHGAPPIQHGENPAAWMLRYVEEVGFYRGSHLHQVSLDEIAAIEEAADETSRIHYDSTYPTTPRERFLLMNARTAKIYKRSPAYNLARLMISIAYAFIIGSIFLQRGAGEEEFNEDQMVALLSTMFFGLIVMGKIFTSNVYTLVEVGKMKKPETKSVA